MTDPKNLVPCQEPGYIQDVVTDPAPPYCRDAQTLQDSGTIDHKPYPDSLRDVAGEHLSWLEEGTLNKNSSGEAVLCDPQQTGHIVNDQGFHPPDRDVVYRYTKSLRGTNEGMKKLFSDVVVYDEVGKLHRVPIIWAHQEGAVAYILQENTRKDDSGIVDRVRLPILAIHDTGHEFNDKRFIYHKAVDYMRSLDNGWKPGFTVKERFERDTVFGVTRGIPIDINYTLVAWAMYEADMNQIYTQIVTKFSKMAYIRVQGVAWEIGVRLTSISNHIETDPGPNKSSVVKFEFGFTAESFIAQPIVRRKAVLKTRIEITNAPNDEDVTEILSRLEQAVKELE